MKASRGCTVDLPYAPYDWDPEFRRCPWTLFQGIVGKALEYWRMWTWTKEGPFAAALADNPYWVRQAIVEFEMVRSLAENEALEHANRKAAKNG